MQKRNEHLAVASDKAVPHPKPANPESLVSCSLESGRLTYLQDPEKGRLRYLKALREFRFDVERIAAELRVKREREEGFNSGK